MQLKVNKDEECKVKALKDNIVEECRKQGFTLDEYVRLVDCLRFVYESKKNRTIQEGYALID